MVGREGLTFGQEEMQENRSWSEQVTTAQSWRTAQWPHLSQVQTQYGQKSSVPQHKETSQHPIRGSQTALGTHCHQSSKPLRGTQGNTEEPGTQQPVSGPRGGAGSGLRNHRDEQEAGMERQCQGSATPDLMAT